MTHEQRPLRVAFFGHGEGRRADGLSTYSREVVRALRRRGVEVHFFAHREDGDILPVDLDAATRLRAHHFKTVTMPRAGSMASIRASLRAFRPDVVHISWSFSLRDGAIARAAHSVGAACVATFHLPHGPTGTTRARILQALYRYHRLHMRHVDRCIVLSDEQGERLAAAGYPLERLTVIANAVDTGYFSPGPSALRDELGARFVALYMGRLDPEKRVPALIEAFTDLALPADHVLCIAGDGVQRERVQRLAAQHPGVRYAGLVSGERRRELLRGCDVFVLPSTAEGLALGMLEAMATGCTVLATDAGEDGRVLTGVGVVIPTHPLRPNLDNALRSVVADAALRSRLGALARERAVADFGMVGHADRVLAAYERARAGMGMVHAGPKSTVAPRAVP